MTMSLRRLLRQRYPTLHHIIVIPTPDGAGPEPVLHRVMGQLNDGPIPNASDPDIMPKQAVGPQLDIISSGASTGTMLHHMENRYQDSISNSNSAAEAVLHQVVGSSLGDVSTPTATSSEAKRKDRTPMSMYESVQEMSHRGTGIIKPGWTCYRKDGLEGSTFKQYIRKMPKKFPGFALFFQVPDFLELINLAPAELAFGIMHRDMYFEGMKRCCTARQGHLKEFEDHINCKQQDEDMQALQKCIKIWLSIVTDLNIVLDDNPPPPPSPPPHLCCHLPHLLPPHHPLFQKGHGVGTLKNILEWQVVKAFTSQRRDWP
ncbi:hypothetical protein EI94DRAFT_1697818 [Lactarius quietus]|nr:hypothetical protein EI94DRAFT_1697818 [Lactarius quietus]